MSKRVKLAAILLALSISTACLAACTEKSEETTKKKKTKKTTTEEISEEETEPDESSSETEPTETSESTTTSATDTSATDSTSARQTAGNSDFHAVSDKIIEAAKSVCGAKEIDQNMKNRMLKDFDPGDDAFTGGAYLKFTPDDIQNFDFTLGDGPIDASDLKNATIFAKNIDEENAIVAVVLEALDADSAADIYEDAYSNTEGFSDDELQAVAQYCDIKYNIYDDYNKYMLALVTTYGDESFGSDYYMTIEGNVVTVIMFSGHTDTGLLDEFYDFMIAAGFEDMEAFLAAGKSFSSSSGGSGSTSASSDPNGITGPTGIIDTPNGPVSFVEIDDVDVRKLSPDEFTSLLESIDYTVIDANQDGSYKTAKVAYNSDMSVLFAYQIFDSAQDAKDYFEEMKTSLADYVSSNTGEFALGNNILIAAESDNYMVAVYTEDMVLYGIDMNGEKDQVHADMKALGIDIG